MNYGKYKKLYDEYKIKARYPMSYMGWYHHVAENGTPPEEMYEYVPEKINTPYTRYKKQLGDVDNPVVSSVFYYWYNEKGYSIDQIIDKQLTIGFTKRTRRNKLKKSIYSKILDKRKALGHPLS